MKDIDTFRRECREKMKEGNREAIERALAALDAYTHLLANHGHIDKLAELYRNKIDEIIKATTRKYLKKLATP